MTERLRLSDTGNIAHGYTGEIATEAFFNILQLSLSQGGVALQAYREANATPNTLALEAYCDGANTTKTTGARAYVEV